MSDLVIVVVRKSVGDSDCGGCWSHGLALCDMTDVSLLYGSYLSGIPTVCTMHCKQYSVLSTLYKIYCTL